MEQSIGKRIMQHRKRLSLTQDQLAEQLGITAQAVSKWENDQSCPDITTLPKLAAIFGITTDELLGHTPVNCTLNKSCVNTCNDSPNEENTMEFHYDSSRRASFAFGTLVLLMGIALLCSRILASDVSFWNLLWPSCLLVYGLFGLYPQFKIFRFGCLLFGGYMLLCNLSLLPFINLPNEYILPIILFLVGIYLLFDARKKPKQSMFSYIRNGKTKQKTYFTINEDEFCYKQAFQEDHRLIQLPYMSNGCIETNFGDYTIDLSGVEKITPACTLHASCHFGELQILVPKRYQVLNNVQVSLGECSVSGSPNAESEGIIQINGDVSFGEIVIKYI